MRKMASRYRRRFINFGDRRNNLVIYGVECTGRLVGDILLGHALNAFDETLLMNGSELAPQNDYLKQYSLD